MDRYASMSEVYDKVGWEGGLVETILGYGLRADSLPEGTPGDIVEAWLKIEAMEDVVNYVEEFLEDHSDDGREYA